MNTVTEIYWLIYAAAVTELIDLKLGLRLAIPCPVDRDDIVHSKANER